MNLPEHRTVHGPMKVRRARVLTRNRPVGAETTGDRPPSRPLAAGTDHPVSTPPRPEPRATAADHPVRAEPQAQPLAAAIGNLSGVQPQAITAGNPASATIRHDHVTA